MFWVCLQSETRFLNYNQQKRYICNFQPYSVLGKESWARTENMFGFFAYDLRMERGSVDTDMVICSKPIPVSLSRLKIFQKFILFFNLIRT